MRPRHGSLFLMTVPHAERALAFYERAFGAEELLRRTRGGRTLIYAALPSGERSLLLEEALNASRIEVETVTLHLHRSEVARTWTLAIDTGARIAEPLGADPSGLECGVLEDPYGHIWALVARESPPSDADLDAAASQFTAIWVPSNRDDTRE